MWWYFNFQYPSPNLSVPAIESHDKHRLLWKDLLRMSIIIYSSYLFIKSVGECSQLQIIGNTMQIQYHVKMQFWPWNTSMNISEVSIEEKQKILTNGQITGYVTTEAGFHIVLPCSQLLALNHDLVISRTSIYRCTNETYYYMTLD